MKSPLAWFVVLSCVCIVAPYALGVPPRTARDRRAIAVTLAFLACILLCMASLR